jgi:hypothetical protein
MDLGFEIWKAFSVQLFVQRRAVTCAQVKAKGFGTDAPEVTAKHNTLILVESIHNIEVIALFDGREDWIVEKVIMGDKNVSVMATPTTWICLAHPYVPMANPSK